MVTTLCSGCPASITLFSISVAVGQVCTQAPQETYSESIKASLAPAETVDAKPRPSIVRAKVPCTSAQARTQREQTMHMAYRETTDKQRKASLDELTALSQKEGMGY